MKTDAAVQQLVDSYGSWVQQENENTAGGTGRMTNALYPYDAMFSPIRVNRLTLKNRLVMAPMGNIDMCRGDGTSQRQDAAVLRMRARRAARGSITTGPYPHQPRRGQRPVTELGAPVLLPPHRPQAAPYSRAGAISRRGVHSLRQQAYSSSSRAGLGRVGNPQCLINELKFPVSASFNPNFYIPQIPVRSGFQRR